MLWLAHGSHSYRGYRYLEVHHGADQEEDGFGIYQDMKRVDRNYFKLFGVQVGLSGIIHGVRVAVASSFAPATDR